ncbi:MAG: hypothetical protein LBG66_02630 [Gallionellaceae bacterium]|jgi:hypothetical protein|nr:hypothetical protein [Gallionellaceae bacterium]
MTKRSLTFLYAGSLLLLLWLFTGVEYIGREDGDDYELFVKQTPSFRVVFENSAQCGECDLRPWYLMTQDDKNRFTEYCAARYGLEVRPCYAIFKEEQRMADEGSSRLKEPVQ